MYMRNTVDNLFWKRFEFEGADEIQEIKYKY